MRKTLIALIILTLSFGVIGCTSDKEETTSNNNEVVTQEESKEEKKRSSDEMYELYASKVDDVEKLFEENNLNFEFKNDKNNKKYDEKISLVYEDSNKDAVGEISVAGYGLAFEENGDIMFISAQISMNVNDEEMKSKEFKFEETEFYKLHNIIVPDIKNTDEINKKVNAAYKELTSLDKVELENGKVEETIVLGDNTINYIIIINP
ncbi:hypothetical protein [uncultured Clostridium sp.]|uniref:hypothetical protein n=1 Tax=uncultured Clostridium sp. TaxID=59620 RepID=UPI00280AFE43|nr:hypothetical protein [uncultured Clostridium sp.]